MCRVSVNLFVRLHLKKKNNRINIEVDLVREEREVIEDCSEPTAFTARVLRQNYLSIYL